MSSPNKYKIRGTQEHLVLVNIHGQNFLELKLMGENRKRVTNRPSNFKQIFVIVVESSSTSCPHWHSLPCLLRSVAARTLERCDLWVGIPRISWKLRI